MSRGRMVASNDARIRIQREEVALLLDDPKFRRFCWRLLSKSGFFDSSARDNPIAISHDEGRRSLGIEVITDLRLARSDALMAILSEFPDGILGGSTGEIEPQPSGDSFD